MSATDPETASTMQALASAYAERLSGIRCGANDVELAANAALIADLERLARAEVAQESEPALAALSELA